MQVLILGVSTSPRLRPQSAISSLKIYYINNYDIYTVYTVYMIYIYVSLLQYCIYNYIAYQQSNYCLVIVNLLLLGYISSYSDALTR
jgi:hypothetical protein